jgi:predicted enzyme related to lactoylglutathione lyase
MICFSNYRRRRGEPMSERDEYPPGVPCWVDTAQPDPRAAMEFYEKVFGWEFVGPGQMPGDPPGEYFVARARGRDVAGVSSLPPEGVPPRPAWNTYVAVASADDAVAAVTEAGGAVVVEPFEALPAGRMAVVTDPAGALFCVWEAADRQGAQLVNEPGAWSMSILNTRDVEGAKAFYGAVFGWVPEEFGGGITLWRLPGYVGGEPAQPVPRDVVAVMAPISADRFPDEVPSHWSVDLWIDDADAAAETAAKHGGTVIAPPFDSPPFRQAVIADPHGASFSVSELQLPA